MSYLLHLPSRLLFAVRLVAPYATHFLFYFFLPCLVCGHLAGVSLDIVYIIVSNSTAKSNVPRAPVYGYAPLTFASYSCGCLMSIAAASPFSGSWGFGYVRSCGRKTSKMLIISYIGDQV